MGAVPDRGKSGGKPYGDVDEIWREDLQGDEEEVEDDPATKAVEGLSRLTMEFQRSFEQQRDLGVA